MSAAGRRDWLDSTGRTNVVILVDISWASCCPANDLNWKLLE